EAARARFPGSTPLRNLCTLCASAARPMRGDMNTQRRALLLAASALFAHLALLNPLDDPDVFMHLAIGRWVAQNGAVPWVDTFASTGEPWIAYSWLFQLVAYGIHASLGWVGLQLAKMGLCAALGVAVCGLVDRFEPRVARAAGIMALATGGLYGSLSPRPWLASAIFLAIELELLL